MNVKILELKVGDIIKTDIGLLLVLQKITNDNLAYYVLYKNEKLYANQIIYSGSEEIYLAFNLFVTNHRWMCRAKII